MSDLRYALRSFAKSPGFTFVAILTLALGMGLVTVQFSFISDALIKGLPFEGAERIQAIEARNAADPRRVMTPLRHLATPQERPHSFEFLPAAPPRVSPMEALRAE